VVAESVSWAGGLVGLVHAVMSISWYVVSRLPDYEADRRVGKTTTVVLLGRASAPTLSAVYLLTGVTLSVVGLVTVGWPFLLTPALGAFMLIGLVRLDPFDPGGASALRYRQMRASTLHAALLALALSVQGTGL
jgi:4-hydroxybenzoate polyprenyltransferase